MFTELCVVIAPFLFHFSLNASTDRISGDISVYLGTDYALTDWINKAVDNNTKFYRLSRLWGGFSFFFFLFFLRQSWTKPICARKIWQQAEGGRSDVRSTCCNGAVTRGTTLHFRPEAVSLCSTLVSEDAVTPWRPSKCIWLGKNHKAAAWRDSNRENFVYIRSNSQSEPAVLRDDGDGQRQESVGRCLS